MSSSITRTPCAQVSQDTKARSMHTHPTTRDLTRAQHPSSLNFKTQNSTSCATSSPLKTVWSQDDFADDEADPNTDNSPKLGGKRPRTFFGLKSRPSQGKKPKLEAADDQMAGGKDDFKMAVERMRSYVVPIFNPQAD